MNTETKSCPLCGGVHKEIREFSPSSREIYYVVNCPVFGAVEITGSVLKEIDSTPWKKERLRQLLAEKLFKDRLQIIDDESRGNTELCQTRLLAATLVIIGDNEPLRENCDYPQIRLKDFLKRYPRNMLEKMERALCNISRLFSIGVELTYVRIDNNINKLFYLLFANDLREAREVCEFLIRENWISSDTSDLLHLTLTVKGWMKVEELEKQWQNSNTAFVAMWFHDSTRLYRQAVTDAIKLAGYEPVIIDQLAHNNFIMDEVINQIRDARFVIADFTAMQEEVDEKGNLSGGVRGGVYFEAGFAKGLGRELIATCCNSPEALKRRHFDISQLNTLFWNEDGGKLYADGVDFTKRLAERIKATVGRGKEANTQKN